MKGAVVWEGASLLDGAPIVLIAPLGKYVNRKTGPVVQTYIMRADIGPTDAARTGDDASVCGDCPHRHHTGDACYVNLGHGPWNIWQAWQRGAYGHLDDEFLDAIRGKLLRIGAYGDPAAVPVDVWEMLAESAGSHIGYTHQWHTAAAAGLRHLCMASVDNSLEESMAQLAGWRTFRVLGPQETPAPRTFQCVNDTKGIQCQDCRACYGARPDRAEQPASVWIRPHGSVAARFTTRRPG
jgi:hypothetical protein